MGTKTVYVHRFEVPSFIDFRKKYYYFISMLLFEHKDNGYYEESIEVIGFTKEEMEILCDYYPYNIFCEDNTLKITNYNEIMLEDFIRVLPEEERERLFDHIVLSSIDKSDNIKDMFISIRELLLKSSLVFSKTHFETVDFSNFFEGKESHFINEYYCSKEEQDDLRLQYKLKG